VDRTIARRPGPGGWGDIYGGESRGWRGAPSWSWASVDGPVHWAREQSGPVFLGQTGIMTKPSCGEQDAYGGLEWAAIRVEGQILEVQQLSGLRAEAEKPETQSDFEKWLITLPLRMQPQIDWDDPSWEEREGQGMRSPLYALVVRGIPPQQAAKGEQAAEGGQAGQQQCLLGYALLLRWWLAEGAFRRVGIAQVALQDFLQTKRASFHIL
jgi:hypothetical protein